MDQLAFLLVILVVGFAVLFFRGIGGLRRAGPKFQRTDDEYEAMREEVSRAAKSKEERDAVMDRYLASRADDTKNTELHLTSNDTKPTSDS